MRAMVLSHSRGFPLKDNDNGIEEKSHHETWISVVLSARLPGH